LASRILCFVLLLLASWTVMTIIHEVGHIIGGTFSGGKLKEFDLTPWHLPYSLFDPDPYPLVTLWCGPIFGVLFPLALAMLIRREWMWLIANFCVLANGAYIATGWVLGDRYLDTSQLLEHGAHWLTIGMYCAATIGFGYFGFRRSCMRLLSSAGPAQSTLHSERPD